MSSASFKSSINLGNQFQSLLFLSSVSFYSLVCSFFHFSTLNSHVLFFSFLTPLCSLLLYSPFISLPFNHLLLFCSSPIIFLSLSLFYFSSLISSFSSTLLSSPLLGSPFCLIHSFTSSPFPTFPFSINSSF